MIDPARGLPFDDEHAPLFGVAQVAAMLHVQPAFVRRLDSEDVVQPARTPGGQRRYSRAEVITIGRVSDMADQGMTLVGIRRILELEAEVAHLQAQLAAARADRRPRR